MEADIADLLRMAEQSGGNGSEQLFSALYGELHRLAARQLRRGEPALTLSTTTLLHEAYIDMARRGSVSFPDQARFMGYAARVMRGIVIDYARRSRALKRGRGTFVITLHGDLEVAPDSRGASAEELERLSDALDELAAMEPGLAELVDLHFFCGFSLCEIAVQRNLSERTVQRDFRKARLLLQQGVLDEGDAAADIR
jgi:RNA polymerase sigma factor (TIGR02999 family)